VAGIRKPSHKRKAQFEKILSAFPPIADVAWFARQAAKSRKIVLRGEHANDAETLIADGALGDRVAAGERAELAPRQRAKKLAEGEGHG
jgi:hypothetical protein